MNILHLVYDDPQNKWVGGGGAIRDKKINEIMAEKNSVTVITGAFPGCKRQETINNVKYYRIGIKFNYLLSRITYSLLVKKIIKRFNPDILIEDISGNAITYSTRHLNRPGIGIVQNYLGINIIKKHFLTGIFSYFYEIKNFKKMYNNFIVVSNDLKRIISKYNREADIEVIPQGIDKSYFSKKHSTEEKYLLYIGRLDFYQKGIDILLKSFAQIDKQEVKLVIVGGGNQKKLFSMIHSLKLRDKIIYKKKVDHNNIIQFYKNSFFLCIPSRYEGWPLVCMESFAFKKPILGTNIPGLNNAVKHNSTGLLARPGDIQDYTKKMKLLLNSSRLRKKLGNAGFKFAKKYTWDNLAKKQFEFYKKIVSKK